jgi:hypothetical protein
VLRLGGRAVAPGLGRRRRRRHRHGGKQTDIAAFFAASSEYAREDFFITTKIPAGIGILTGLCLGGADKALRQVEASVLWP